MINRIRPWSIEFGHVWIRPRSSSAMIEFGHDL
jgi:hypothetical protein